MTATRAMKLLPSLPEVLVFLALDDVVEAHRRRVLPPTLWLLHTALDAHMHCMGMPHAPTFIVSSHLDGCRSRFKSVGCFTHLSVPVALVDLGRQLNWRGKVWRLSCAVSNGFPFDGVEPWMSHQIFGAVAEIAKTLRMSGRRGFVGDHTTGVAKHRARCRV